MSWTCILLFSWWNIFLLITLNVSSVPIHTVLLTWCFLGSGDISCGMNLIGPFICLLDRLVPSGSVSMAISASSLLAWSHSEHCLKRRKTACLNEPYWFYYRGPKSLSLHCKRKTKPSQLLLIKRWKTRATQKGWVKKKRPISTNMFNLFLINNSQHCSLIHFGMNP